MRKSKFMRVLIEVRYEDVRIRVLKQATNGHGHTGTLEQDAARINGLPETLAHTPFMLIFHKGGAA